MKKNFFSARKVTCIDDVYKSLPGWVERKNKRIHKATFKVPLEVFQSVEKEALRPLIPSVYENSPSSFIQVKINSTPYIQYRSSKYSVPRTYCFSTMHYKMIGTELFIYDSDRRYVCSHPLNECRGSINQLEEHRKVPSDDWITVMESLRSKWDCYSFQHFINGFKKENPRHIYQQLSAVERFLDSEKPERFLVSQVMDGCIFRYRNMHPYSDFLNIPIIM